MKKTIFLLLVLVSIFSISAPLVNTAQAARPSVATVQAATVKQEIANVHAVIPVKMVKPYSKVENGSAKQDWKQWLAIKALSTAYFLVGALGFV